MVGNKKMDSLCACATVHLVNIALYPQIKRCRLNLHPSPVPTARKSYVKSTCCKEIDPINKKLSEVDLEIHCTPNG